MNRAEYFRKAVNSAADTAATALISFVSGTAIGTYAHRMLNKEKTNNMLSLKELSTTLEDDIKKSSEVFIVGHNNPDLDSVGSAMGLYRLATALGKKAYIILDDNSLKEPATKRLISDNKDKYKFIKKSTFLNKVTKKSLLIMTDVNQKNRISVGDSLDQVGNIFILDHHNIGDNTVQTEHKYINEKESSASEIVARILLKKNKLKKDTATALLAGISLDTKRFQQSTNASTLDVAEKLVAIGANQQYVNKLFQEDYETHCRIENLIINETLILRLTKSLLSPIQVSITLNRTTPKAINVKEDLAKAADKMLTFEGVDASFVIGFTEPGVICISARGTDRVNVGKIIKKVNGGGTPASAAATIESDDILGKEQELIKSILSVVGETEEILEKPVQLTKRRQYLYDKNN